MQCLKLVIVGDGGVGKSSFLITATTNLFPCNYVPTVFDNYSASIMVNGKPFSVSLWDTAGQEDYDRLRPLSYPQTDVFVVSFDVASTTSFQNVTEKWIPEVRRFGPLVPILLLATKTDLRGNKNPTSPCRHVTEGEGKSLASSQGATYAECSSLLNDGVQQAINKAVELAVTHSSVSRHKKKTFKLNKETKPLPPILPPAGLAPHVEVLTSSFASEWHNMMSDKGSADVNFLFSDGQHAEAHKIVLIAASSVFKSILLHKVTLSGKTYEDIIDNISWVCDEEDHCLNLVHSKEKCRGKGKTIIYLHKSLSKGVFMEVLTFLYTGTPGIAEDEDVNFVKEIQSVAIKFQLHWLEAYCTNILNNEAYLNPSIGTWINDNTGLSAKNLFLNKQLHADVKFQVEGSIVYGHRVILKARSEVMAAMLSGAFREGDVDTEISIQYASLESFLALLEYLYTDHAPIEEGDSVEIMALADRFCLPRLVTLCELYITKKVDKAVQKKVADGTDDVIDLLLTSQAHNAKQLSNWCLHFIATNYSVFEKCEEFHLVQGENREYVYEHRWPPLSYLKAQEEFERKMEPCKPKCKCRKSKCKVM